MGRVMCHPRLLLLVLMVCSDQVAEISWCYELYPRDLVQSWKQSSSNDSRLLANLSEEANDGHNVDHVALYQSNTDTKSVLSGGMATFEAYSLPNLDGNDKVSSSEMWVYGVLPKYNAISAGWTVNPSAYGDTKTHFFTSWTDDDNKPGCYNLGCDGFVPVNYAPITPGDTLEPNNGQLKVTIKLFKSQNDGDWWLHFGYDSNNLKPVGYWPKSLFSSLADHANGILVGGYTQSHTGNASPPMGNGQWPGKNSAAIRDVKYVDSNGQGYKPAPWPAGLTAKVSHKNCYQVSPFLDDMFYYGGPGGCTS